MPQKKRRPLILAVALDSRSRCHGYAHGCSCTACEGRAQIVADHIAAGREPYTAAGKLRKPPAKKAQDTQPWTPGPPRSRSE